MDYTPFTVGDVSFKAYHNLKNLNHIESHGINLNNVFSGLGRGEMPSISTCQNILIHALWVDVPSLSERKKFSSDYFKKVGAYKASDDVLKFVFSALRVPEDKEGDDTEKKT